MTIVFASVTLFLCVIASLVTGMALIAGLIYGTTYNGQRLILGFFLWIAVNYVGWQSAQALGF